jgi:hypothetical protein
MSRSTARRLLCAALLAQAAFGAPAPPKTRNVIFVMTDGLRWQEVFRGTDAALLDKKPAERREALMPFLWQTMARYGQVYGNRDLGSEAYVTNGFNFSYPGYSETLCGFADARIHSNDNVPNPNVTVLEWLERKPKYSGRVAAFGAWEVISAVVNPARSGVLANAGYEPLLAPPITPSLDLINRLKADTNIWDDESFDSFTFYTAAEYLKLHHPRVLYLSLGETDEWAHQGNYDAYLKAAHRADRFVRELWQTVQSIPEYRGATTLIFSPDHGRGDGGGEWRNHGEKVPDSKYIWMAFLGPDTPALGERAHIAPVTQSQIAATLAALLGEDYNADVPKAGKPIRDVLPQ